MKSNRPRIQIKLSTSDKILETIGILLLICYGVGVALSYPLLPDTIPIHYNASGEIDGYGAKESIFGLLIVGILLYIGLSVLTKYPHHFNYPIDITPQNAEKQYTAAIRMVRILKVSIVIIFALIECQTVLSAIGHENTFGKFFMPLVILLMFGPLIYYMIKSSK
ncbi:MAG: DUF1648 domain-containing protein [Flavobacterium sp.]|nr:DUF1648 domain-containing protein [Flavobacterium sp.]